MRVDEGVYFLYECVLDYLIIEGVGADVGASLFSSV